MLTSKAHVTDLIAACAPFTTNTIRVEAEDSMFTTGLGHLDVQIDVSAALNEISRAVTDITATVEDSDEQPAEYSASLPAATATPTDGTPTIFTTTVTNAACEDETHTVMAFRHEFATAGTHRISLRFGFSGGDYITTPAAILVHAGSGLAGGACA